MEGITIDNLHSELSSRYNLNRKQVSLIVEEAYDSAHSGGEEEVVSEAVRLTKLYDSLRKEEGN